MKKQMAIIILITGLLVTGIVYGEDPGKVAATDSGSGSGMGWQAHTKRTPVMINDGIKISAGPSAGSSGIGMSISFSSNFNIIECCQQTTLVQSWCNFNADDMRCAN